MLVFWEQRLVLLATPKTGSTALEVALESLATVSVLRPPELKHTSAHRYRRFVAPYLERSAGAAFTVVALMREPVDWLGSWYRFGQREDSRGGPGDTSGMSFEDYASAYLAQPRPAVADVGSQHRFLSHDDRIGVDRVFRYETLGQFVTFLEERLNFAIVLPRVNVSPLASLALAPETEARLRQVCAADFALYDSIAAL